MDVASVEDGVVTALLEGSTIIYASAGRITGKCNVTVRDPEFKEIERKALVALYNSAGGPSWVRKTNWLSSMPVSDWAGITMTDDGRHVKGIEIMWDNVTGYIPEEIGDLSELEFINIGSNLDVHTKSGPLPESIGKLKKLKMLAVQVMDISGTLPAGLFTLPSLETLILSNQGDNKERETFPAEIGNLTNLESLFLRNLNLSGSLPDELGNLTRLKELSLASNSLSGSLPSSLSRLVNLEYVELSGNYLSGDIPTGLSKINNYSVIWPGFVEGNYFTQDDIRNAKIPAPKSPPVTDINGKTLDIEQYIESHNYTVLFNVAPGMGGVSEYYKRLKKLYDSHKDNGFGIITYLDNNANNSREYDNEFKAELESVGADWEAFSRHTYQDYPEGTAPFYSISGNPLFPGGTANSIVVIGPDHTVCYTTVVDRDYYNHLENALVYLEDLLN